jgi:hypothetical protein
MTGNKIRAYCLNLIIIVISTSTLTIFSRSAEANGICFMKTSQGQLIDLAFLCGRKSLPVIRPNNYDSEFTKDLTEALSGYPAEKEILAKISPKKFADEARNICEKLRDGTFTQYRDRAIAVIPDRETDLEQFRAKSTNGRSTESSDRAITNISFNLSKELGTKHYCKEFND